MLKLIEGLPPDVLAIEAIGIVTHDDYRKVLIPKAEAMMATGPIRMLYIVGKEFKSFALEAMWDDGAFGLKHWHEFSRIAVVADQAWLRGSVSMFAPLIPAEIRLFSLSEQAGAKDWIVAPRKAAA